MTAESEELSNLVALVHEYYAGMVRGDPQLLRQVFDPPARFQGVRDGTQVRRDLEEFVKMTQSPPADSSQAGDGFLRVEMADLTGDVAVVKVRDRFRGRMYVDYLTMMKTATGWRIVNKAFTTVD